MTFFNTLLKAEKCLGFLIQHRFIFSVRVASVAGEMITVPTILNLPSLRTAMYRAAMTVSKKMFLKRYLPSLAPAALARDGLDGNLENCSPLDCLLPGGCIGIHQVVDTMAALHPAGCYHLFV